MAFKSFWVQYKIGKKSDQIYIDKKSFTLGRAPECELSITSDKVSRKHLKVSFEDGKIYVEDLGSTNGTFLNNGLLEPNEAYEYKTSDRLHIDSSKEVQLKITLVEDSASTDIEIDIARAEIERRRQRRKGSHLSQTHEEKNNYLVAATESVDNIFDNLLFIAKTARFNKEKQIKEAEYISQELIEKAQKEIEDNRALLEHEIRILQEETKNEAKRLINSATAKAEQLLTQATDRAKKINFEADDQARQTRELAEDYLEEKRKAADDYHRARTEEADNYKKAKIQEADDYDLAKKMEADQRLRKAVADGEKIVFEKRTEGENVRKQLLIEAQDKYSEIIADAHIRNKELQADNQGLVQEIANNHGKIQDLKGTIQALQEQEAHHDRLYQESKKRYSTEMGHYNDLKSQVLEMEAKAEKARKALDQEIPAQEKKLQDLLLQIKGSEVFLKKNLTQSNELEVQIQAQIKDLEKAERKNESWEARLDDLNKKIIEAEDNLFRLNKLRQQRNEELDSEIAERRRQQKALEEATHQQLAHLKAKSDKEIEVSLASAKSQAEELLHGAQQAIAKARESARNEIAQWKLSAQQELESVKKSAQSLKIQSEQSAQELVATAHAKADSLVNEAQAKAEAYLANAQQEAQKLKEDSQAEARDKIAQATAKASELEAKANKIYQEEKKRAESAFASLEAETERKRVAAQRALDTDLQSQHERFAEQMKVRQNEMEAEFLKRREEAQREIQEMRTQAVKALDEQKERLAREEQERSRIRAIKLQKDLNDLLRARMTPFLKDKEAIEKVGQILNKSVSAVILDEIDEDFKDSLDYSDIDPTAAQNKVKKFWMMSAGGLVAVIMFLVLLPKFKEAAVESGRSLANYVEEDTKKAIERAQKENDLNREFKPDKVPDYLDSYTDRILYTEDYVKIELSPAFREQWILELQDFFVHTLRLDENNLVPFIALEANLIQELEDQFSKINGNFADEGIKRMRETEESFQAKIRQNVKTSGNYNKVMAFKKDFFDKNKGLAK